MGSALKDLLDSIGPLENGHFDKNPNLCECAQCGNTFKVEDCITNYDHHDGWEMPAYAVDECPVCPNGGDIHNYFYSVENDPCN